MGGLIGVAEATVCVLAGNPTYRTQSHLLRR